MIRPFADYLCCTPRYHVSDAGRSGRFINSFGADLLASFFLRAPFKIYMSVVLLSPTVVNTPSFGIADFYFIAHSTTPAIVTNVQVGYFL